MKFLFAVCVLALFALATAETYSYVPLLYKSDVRDDHGQFSLRYITADGSDVREQGVLEPSNDGTGYVLVKEGEYSFIAPDGHKYTTTWVADRYGFRAMGDHLPRPVTA